MKHASFILRNARSMLCGIAIFLAALSLGSSTAFSASPTKLNWEMLMPPTEPLAIFFEDIPFEQQEALRNILNLKNYPSGDVDEELAARRHEASKGSPSIERTSKSKASTSIRFTGDIWYGRRRSKDVKP